MRGRREHKQRIRALRAVPLLATCTDAQLARVDRLGTKLVVRSGAVLAREGAVARECFLVLSNGRMFPLIESFGGKPISSISPGAVVGEMALLGGSPRCATVVAVSPMCVLVLTAGEFGALRQVCPSVDAALHRIAAERWATLEFALVG